MFIFYLAEKYGLKTVEELIQTDVDGTEAIELVLLNNGYNISFNEVYLNWITACTLDLQEINNNIYAFENADFKIDEMTLVQDLPLERGFVKQYYYGFDVKKFENPPDKFTLQIDTPRSPYGLGIVSAIYDKKGWNITKKLIFEENDTITQFYSGEEIEFAYIITSLMKDSPNAPLTWFPPPFDELNYNFVEGNKNPEIPTITPTKTSYTGLIMILSSIIICNLILNVRRRKQTGY